ncbi:hypothetical protein PACTADRAFT_33569 [Pachysolen tannophilus NRRL Y-2460]|uniref:Deoxycytidylate deaminase n=1 Tax=Pachysolen tannophilus NRRL Y-2460 TaxID=669874 RepID=A0A1E4TXA7_PACTA|nr:hypothetical protein PACTADRAFT_33569 [Pachysolen tannophilus NRRL Y-2460]
MFIGISGTLSSGKTEVARYLTYCGFKYIDYKRENDESNNLNQALKKDLIFDDYNALIIHVTKNWKENFVITHLDDHEFLSEVSIRPFFLHVTVDAPVARRYERYILKHELTKDEFPLVKFIESSDHFLLELEIIFKNSDFKIINSTIQVEQFYQKLSELNLLKSTRLRPNWDNYFMSLADLASRRSNCMKRRVGCVIVKDNRVIATGYNGTPRNLKNCNEGGCERCNRELPDSNCLCLHAEENALLYSNKANGSTLYCDTCPCLQCTIKIIQCGIREVVYKKEYKFDQQSKSLFDQSNVLLRRYQD